MAKISNYLQKYKKILCYITGHKIKNYKVKEALALEQVLIDDGLVLISYNEHESGASINYARFCRQLFWCLLHLTFLIRCFLLTFMESKYLGNYLRVLGKGGLISNFVLFVAFCSLFILRLGLIYSQCKNGHTLFWLFSKFSEDSFDSSYVCGLKSKDFLKLRMIIIISYHLKKIFLPLFSLWGLIFLRFCFLAIKSSDDNIQKLCYFYWVITFTFNVISFISKILAIVSLFVHSFYFAYRYEDLNNQVTQAKSFM